MLAAWDGRFGNRPTTVKDAIRFAETAGTDATAQALADAIDEVAGERGRPNSRILGRWIERQVGRRHGGRWFVRGRMLNGYGTWAIEREPRRPAESNPLKPTKPTDVRSDGDDEAPSNAGQVGLVDASGFPAAEPPRYADEPSAVGPATEVF